MALMTRLLLCTKSCPSGLMYSPGISVCWTHGCTPTQHESHIQQWQQMAALRWRCISFILQRVAPEQARAHQASCSAVTASLGLMAGQGMLLPAALEDRRREWLLSPSVGTLMLGRFQPGTAAEASCTAPSCMIRT